MLERVIREQKVLDNADTSSSSVLRPSSTPSSLGRPQLSHKSVRNPVRAQSATETPQSVIKNILGTLKNVTSLGISCPYKNDFNCNDNTATRNVRSVYSYHLTLQLHVKFITSIALLGNRSFLYAFRNGNRQRRKLRNSLHFLH